MVAGLRPFRRPRRYEAREVDIRLRDFVEEVREHVFGYQGHELHDLGFAVAGFFTAAMSASLTPPRVLAT